MPASSRQGTTTPSRLRWPGLFAAKAKHGCRYAACARHERTVRTKTLCIRAQASIDCGQSSSGNAVTRLQRVQIAEGCQVLTCVPKPAFRHEFSGRRLTKYTGQWVRELPKAAVGRFSPYTVRCREQNFGGCPGPRENGRPCWRRTDHKRPRTHDAESGRSDAIDLNESRRGGLRQRHGLITEPPLTRECRRTSAG